MKINVSNLSDGVHAFHFSAEPAHLELGSTYEDNVVVDATVDKSGREMLLRAEASTKRTFLCDRCLDEFHREVKASYEIVYLYDEKEKSRFPDSEVQIVSAGTPFIDLTDDVRQFLLLAVPVKVLCKEGCRGLCPNCGTNRNDHTCSCKIEVLDPRWQVLKSTNVWMERRRNAKS